MKIFVFVLTALYAISAWAGPERHYPVHLDLETSSENYERFLLSQNSVIANFEDIFAGDPLAAIVKAGKRNLDWLTFINQHRETPLSFTKPGSLKGIPIDKPQKYSGDMALNQYQEFLKTLPESVKQVLTGTAPFPENPTVPDDQYVELGHKMDYIYQTALRWQSMLPWLSWYEENRISDIRGYYFLTRTENLESLLRNWDHLPADQQATLQEWLLGECYNRQADEKGCRDLFTNAAINQMVWEFHQNHLSFAKAQFDSFYEIPRTRRDLFWSRKNQTVATMPIRDPKIPAILDFLKVNIEDEWKWNGWQLRLDFQPKADVHVQFQPGVTPHVNAIAGNTIVMDQNTPLSEWDVQWTIRHEYGHVLGFPDCYVEFYDPNEKVMISYQLDVDDLMCSRAGKLQEHHFMQLQSKYLRD